MKTSTLPLTLFLLAGCVTSSKMPAKKIEQLEPNEGRVIGSVLLTVPTEKDPSSWAWLQGRKAESFTYELSIQARKMNSNWVEIVRAKQTKTRPRRIPPLSRSISG